ncbi:MAG: hypothetical protein SCH70_08515 [Candidatus Methanoperedens sp.]|nr:hypothetical protein [Candidatus Methanoperedens sp.]
MIESPEDYYNEGKAEGKLNREKGFGGTGKTVIETKSPVEVTGPGKIDNPGYGNIRADRMALLLPHNKLNELPKMVNKIRVTGIPQLLKGIKHLRRK